MNNTTLIYKTHDRIVKSIICKKRPRKKGKKKEYLSSTDTLFFECALH